MTATLAIDGLKVAIGDANVLRGVSLEVEPGEVRGLVGEYGAGKSMLGRAVLGLLPANATVTSGHIAFEGRDMLAMRGLKTTMSLYPVEEPAPAMVARARMRLEEALDNMPHGNWAMVARDS